MRTIDLTCGKASARILPDVGFNCFEFVANVDDRAVSVLESGGDFASGAVKPSHGGIPILFPYPNRILNGRFGWNGKSYELPDGDVPFDGAGNAIHGFCLDRPWRVTEVDSSRAKAEFRLSLDAADRRPLWPADFLIEVAYDLGEQTLSSQITISNPDSVPLPWGFGTHPYFRLPLETSSSPSACLIEAPASEQWELVECIPTGKRVPVSDRCDLREGQYYDLLKLDDVLTGLPEEHEILEMNIIDEQAGLQINQRCSQHFREIVAFTPPWATAVALEPYTCVSNAANLEPQGIDAGWQSLPPGESVSLWIEIEAGAIVV